MTPKRSYNYKGLDKVVMKYKDAWVGFDAKELIANEENVMVTDGNDNYGLFEFHRTGVYWGHYMFSSRGAVTIKIARNLLGFFFKEFPVRAVLGLTPVEHAGAIRLNEKLGFTFHNVVETEAGPHYQVSLKKEDFKYE